MTRIAIVGGGRAATLHAEATLATPEVDLVGVGGRPGSAAELSKATGVPDLALVELVERADGLVIAVTPDETAGVVDLLPPELPLLIESPVRLRDSRARAMTGANLLHATVVKRGLRAVAGLGAVHHIALRGRAVRRDGATDVFSEPFAGAWPVLLMAAGASAVSVTGGIDRDRATATLELSDGRSATAQLEWVAPEAGSVTTELELASSTGVVTIGLWPMPTLEIDGRTVDNHDDHPLISLGFVEQMRRFAATCAGRGDPWPPLTVGIGVTTLTNAAIKSAAAGGARIPTR
jgi:predicted dehydrogenase